MAIDSLDKRSSCIGFTLCFYPLAPAPDSDISSLADRQQLVSSYRGIEASGFAAEGNSTANPYEDRYTNAAAYGGVSNVSYNEALIAMMQRDLANDSGTINELMVRWLQLRLGTSEGRLSALQQLAAADVGVDDWEQIHDLTAIGAS